jgi:hypothetical protein
LAGGKQRFEKEVSIILAPGTVAASRVRIVRN